MNYATNIAIVVDTIVTNIIWGMIYQLDEFEQMYNCEAVVYDDLAVQIGDRYINGIFYHGEDPVRTRTEIWEGILREEDNYLINELYETILEGVEL